MPYSDRDKYLNNQKEYYKKRKQDETFKVLRMLESLKCPVCLDSFIQKTPQQKYCSTVCNKRSPITKATQKRHRQENREKYKEYELTTKLRKYGISKEIYLQMYVDQQNCCKICGTHEKDTKQKELCIDYNHTTGEVRGLLCHPCNVALGFFRDNVELLNKAINYVKTEGKVL